MSVPAISTKIRPGDHIRVVARSLAELWRAAPALTALFLLASLVEALVPAVQVMTVRALTNAVGGSLTATLWLVVLVAAMLGLGQVAGDTRGVLGTVAARRLTSDVRARIAETMATFTPQQLADDELAVAARGARDAVDEHLNFHGRNSVQGLVGVVTMFGLLVALWPTNQLAALLLLAALLVQYPFLAISSKIEGKAFAPRAVQERFANYFTEQLVYQRTASELVALGTGARMAGWVRERFRRAADIFIKAMLNSLVFSIGSGFATAFFAGLALLVIVRTPGMTAGDLAAGVVGVLASAGSVFYAGLAFGSIMSATVPVRETFAFIDRGKSVTAMIPTFRDVDHVVADDVGFTYANASQPALANVSLELCKGEVVAFVGLNGAGKTTLVNCLAGLLTPTQGQVRFDGVPVCELSAEERLGAVALLTQEFGRYELTVREAVALGSPMPVDDDSIWAALTLARADGFVRAMPEGLDAQLGQQWKGIGLSGGQWQRIALARIALRGAPIWLLDEPTSAVDAVTEEKIFTDLVASKADRITVVVSHRAWTLRSVDRIYVFVDGHLVEQGTYEELSSGDGAFAQMFAFQQ